MIIIDPRNGKSFNISSKKGLNILKLYMNQIGGESWRVKARQHRDELERQQHMEKERELQRMETERKQREKKLRNLWNSPELENELRKEIANNAAAEEKWLKTKAGEKWLTNQKLAELNRESEERNRSLSESGNRIKKIQIEDRTKYVYILYV